MPASASGLCPRLQRSSHANDHDSSRSWDGYALMKSGAEYSKSAILHASGHADCALRHGGTAWMPRMCFSVTTRQSALRVSGPVRFYVKCAFLTLGKRGATSRKGILGGRGHGKAHCVALTESVLCTSDFTESALYVASRKSVLLGNVGSSKAQFLRLHSTKKRTLQKAVTQTAPFRHGGTAQNALPSQRGHKCAFA